MPPQVFKVLSEFKFETGSAMVNAGQLNGAVQKLSNTANEALFTLNRLAVGFASNLGIGTTSILSLLGKAIQVSDKFQTTQLKFSNIISANLDNLSGSVNTFNDRLRVSEKIMKDIAKDAITFSLDEDTLLRFTGFISAQLIPKGLAGVDFSEARNLSRNLMKAAPSLGVTPADVGGQLMRTIEGAASRGDPLFMRLLGETKAFEKFRNMKDAARKFNEIPLEERFKTISAGLRQFTSDMEILDAQAGTLDRRMIRLKNVIFGVDSILKPLGDLLIGPVKEALTRFTDILKNEGRLVLDHLTKILKSLIIDIERLIVDLLQLKGLAKDMKGAGFASTIMYLVSFLGLFKKLGLKILIGGAAVAMAAFFKGIAAGTGLLIKIFPVINSAFAFITASLVAFLAPLLVITAVIQTLRRAWAIAKVKDAKAMIELMPKFTALMEKLSRVMHIIVDPVMDFMNTIADKISIVFQFAHWWKVGLWLLEQFIDTLVSVFAGWRGLVWAVATAFQEIGNIILNFTTGIALALQGDLLGAKEAMEKIDVGESFYKTMDALNKGVEDFYQQTLEPVEPGAEPTVKNEVNINKVEIRNDFKEQLEPDRIAFTIKEQLLKVAQNPVSGRRQGFAQVGLSRG